MFGWCGKIQEIEKFEQAGLTLMFQNYTHLLYPQFRSEKFIACLSVFEIVFHLGLERVREIHDLPTQQENSN